MQDKIVTIRRFHFRVFRVFRGSFFFRPGLISPAMRTNLIYEDESYQLIGASFEVYREKGCGFLEAVYQACLAMELHLRGVLFVSWRSGADTRMATEGHRGIRGIRGRPSR